MIIPGNGGRSYSGETGSPWAVRLTEHRRHLAVGHLERSTLAQHSFEENRRVLREEAKTLENEKNSVYRKCQEEAYRACKKKKKRVRVI